MSKNIKSILLFIIILLFIVSVFLYIHILPEKKIFDGFIVWGRESVYFVDNITIQEDNNVKFNGDPIWVEEGEKTNDLYKSAYIANKGDEYNINDDLRIIKVKFEGLYYESSKDVPVSPYNFTSKVKIVNIIDYSGDIK